MLTPEQIVKIGEETLPKWVIRPTEGSSLDAFARAIYAQALKDAAAICQSANNYDNPMTANDCAAAILALGKE